MIFENIFFAFLLKKKNVTAIDRYRGPVNRSWQNSSLKFCVCVVPSKVFKTGLVNEPKKSLGGWVTGSTVGSNWSNRDDVIIMS